MRRDIEFKTERDMWLRGWLYTPKQGPRKAPCIIMTHGFSALKEHYLDQFAARFAAAGMFVLVYDHRNFGASDGDCRFEVDPAAQMTDMKKAITFVQGLAEVNANCVGLWGTSFSAGVALAVAASDHRVASVVAQVPFVSGHHDFLRQKKPERFALLRATYEADRLNRAAGQTPAMVKVVTDDPQESVIMNQSEAYTFFTSCSKWQNKVTLRSVENAGDFYPIKRIADISPIPILFIVAEHDTVNLTHLALQACAQALAPKKQVMIAGHHFSPYREQFERCVMEATKWFSSTLLME